MKKFTLCFLFFASVTISFNIQAQTPQKDYHSYPYWIDMMEDPNTNFFETQRAFEIYWQGREITKGCGYKLFKRWEYWMSSRVSPDGTKPSPYRNMEAIKQLESQSNRSAREGNWVSLGPSSVPSGYDGYRGLGRVNAIAFDPVDVNTVYAGAPSGGLWVTHDGGSTWSILTDEMPTLGVSAIAVDYLNPAVIYIGTGDRDHSDAPGAGIWKSVDGGLTFQPSNSGMEQITISKLIIHPTDPNILIASSNGGIYRSTNGGTSWVNSISDNFKDVVFKPGNPNIVYAAAAGSFYRSVNNGQTFTEITNGLQGGYRGAIAVTPAAPDMVYFFITNSEDFKGLYRSTDSGLTFTLRSNSPNIMSWDCAGGDGGQAWYDLDMAASPVNANVIYGGGVNCFKSSDGGITWAINSHWWGDCGVPSVHADLHVLEYNPLNNRLYAGNDGGVYWTDNGGSSWNEISNGLIISQAYKIGQSATVRDNVINGYQDNGTSTFAGDSWINLNGGDGMECAYDPIDGNYSYSTLYYGPIFRHFNHGGGDQVAGEGFNGINESGGWVTPFVIDHNDGNTMFVGYDNIWRSTNVKNPSTSGIVWTKISNININDFDQMKQSDANTNILYVSNDNQLYRTDNAKGATVTWTNLTSSLPTGNYISALETSPVDENIVYLVQQTRVFKSINKGSSWTEITGALPNVQMNTLAYYHNSNEGLYLGTDVGVFYRDATNPVWVQFNTGLPSAAIVTELEIFYDNAVPPVDMIRAGTFGRGLWESTMINADPPSPAGIISGPVTVCSGQSQVAYSVDEITGATSYNWTLPAGAVGNSNTNTILVDFGPTATSGNISVYGTNLYGNGPSSSLAITVNPLPGEAGIISGPAEVCQGSTAIVYSVTPIPDVTSYQWTLPEGATGESTTNTISVDFGSTAITGDISVNGSNDCGVSNTSALQVIVSTLPGDAGVINGPTTVCQGDSNITYFIDEIPGADSYIWTFPLGTTLINSTPTSCTLSFSLTAVSDYLSVSGMNACGTGPASSLEITVNEKPATPIITRSGHDLHSDAPLGNQWHDQNGAINGAINQDYEVLWDGDYYSIVTLADCKSDTSNVINVIVTGISPEETPQGIVFYPNPFTNELTIEKKGNNDKIKFEIINPAGQIIKQGILLEKVIVDTRHLSKGIYMLKFEDGTSVELRKLIKE